MKTVVFTHNDLDGVACGIVALHYFPDANVHYCSYQNIESVIAMFLNCNRERNMKDYRLVLSDISFKKDSPLTSLIWSRHFGSIIIADHHKTSVWMNHHDFGSNQIYRSIESDGDYSAAYLLHELLSGTHYRNIINGEQQVTYNPEMLATFTKVVSEWDTWTWTNSLDHTDVVTSMKTNLPYFLSTLMNTVSISTFVSRFVMGMRSCEALRSDNLEWLIDFVFTDDELNNTRAVIDNSFEQMKDLSIEYKLLHTKKSGDIKFGFVSLQDYSQTSIASEYIKQTELLDKDAAFLAMTSGTNPKGVSLRLPAQNYDVSIIATEFGGGGHSAAAGCDFNEFMKSVFNKSK